MLTLLALTLSGMLVLFLGFTKNKELPFYATMLFLAICFALNLCPYVPETGLGDMLSSMMQPDTTSVGFSAIILLSALAVVPLTRSFALRDEGQSAEYYAIILFSLVGALMMTNYENLLMLFIGLEILSVSLYVLTGSDKRNAKSNEAALKYLLMGSFATGILLFGMALLYGASGGFSLSALREVSEISGDTSMLYLGLFMLLFGMLFKVSAAPFHFWTPDVYEGAPDVFTAYMSTVVKTAGFAAIYKLLSFSFNGVYDVWFLTILVITVLTLFVGNIIAASQDSFKRMMAYSSISHAGYLLMAVLAFNHMSVKALMFYSLAYSLATISAFGVLIAVSGQNKREDYNSFNGLAKANPFLAFVMTISMLSLAGIPLTAGFFGKFNVLSAAFNSGYLWLLVFAMVMSAVGVYYYFRVIIAMYIKPAAQEVVGLNIYPALTVTLAVTSFLTILFGLLPDLARLSW